MAREIRRRIKDNERILEEKLAQASLNQAVDPERINHTLDYPRLVLTESRSIWSDGSVTTEVRTFSKGN